MVVVEDDKDAVAPQELRTTALSIRTTSEELKCFGSLIDVNVSFGFFSFEFKSVSVQSVNRVNSIYQYLIILYNYFPLNMTIPEATACQTVTG